MSKSNRTEINLGEIGGPVFLGRKKGEQARAKFKLDDADKDQSTYLIIVPESAYALASSFFLGLFGDSIRAAGSPDKFLAKFEFKSSDSIKTAIDSCIVRALHEHRELISHETIRASR